MLVTQTVEAECHLILYLFHLVPVYGLMWYSKGSNPLAAELGSCVLVELFGEDIVQFSDASCTELILENSKNTIVQVQVSAFWYIIQPVQEAKSVSRDHAGAAARAGMTVLDEQLCCSCEPPSGPAHMPATVRGALAHEPSREHCDTELPFHLDRASSPI
jgi:hypothetical protein